MRRMVRAHMARARQKAHAGIGSRDIVNNGIIRFTQGRSAFVVSATTLLFETYAHARAIRLDYDRMIGAAPLDGGRAIRFWQSSLA